MCGGRELRRSETRPISFNRVPIGPRVLGWSGAWTRGALPPRLNECGGALGILFNRVPIGPRVWVGLVFGRAGRCPRG